MNLKEGGKHVTTRERRLEIRYNGCRRRDGARRCSYCRRRLRTWHVHVFVSMTQQTVCLDCSRAMGAC